MSPQDFTDFVARTLAAPPSPTTFEVAVVPTLQAVDGREAWTDRPRASVRSSAAATSAVENGRVCLQQARLQLAAVGVEA